MMLQMIGRRLQRLVIYKVSDEFRVFKQFLANYNIEFGISASIVRLPFGFFISVVLSGHHWLNISGFCCDIAPKVSVYLPIWPARVVGLHVALGCTR